MRLKPKTLSSCILGNVVQRIISQDISACDASIFAISFLDVASPNKFRFNWKSLNTTLNLWVIYMFFFPPDKPKQMYPFNLCYDPSRLTPLQAHRTWIYCCLEDKGSDTVCNHSKHFACSSRNIEMNDLALSSLSSVFRIADVLTDTSSLFRKDTCLMEKGKKNYSFAHVSLELPWISAGSSGLKSDSRSGRITLQLTLHSLDPSPEITV